jgi:hypothetical protein
LIAGEEEMKGVDRMPKVNEALLLILSFRLARNLSENGDDVNNNNAKS